MNASINGKEYSFEPGETILQVARRNGIFIPTLCHFQPLDHKPGTCRVCLAEVTDKNGRTEMLTTCNTPMQEGMRVNTRSSRVRNMQRLQVELIFADHDQDCASCSRHGNCELQDLALYVGLQHNSCNGRFTEKRPLDWSANGLVRDANKCIRCYRCVEVCRQVQGVSALTMDNIGNECGVGIAGAKLWADSAKCVQCGQCSLVCPTGALSEKDQTEVALDWFSDPEIKTVVAFAPAVRVTLGDAFQVAAGTNLEKRIVTALKQLGADYVCDINWAADVTIMEEGTELLERLNDGGTLPMMTSCCPGWVNFVEKVHPEIIPNLSTTRSPQAIFGSLAKTWFAREHGINPDKLRFISIMPCTAKKDEILRPESRTNGRQDVDYVLTTEELIGMIQSYGLTLNGADKDAADMPFGITSGAGLIFGASGGVTEAVLRNFLAGHSRQDIDELKRVGVREENGIREFSFRHGDREIRAAVVSGLRNADMVLNAIREGGKTYDFVEFMACPGGCIMGGGQPVSSGTGMFRARRDSLYEADINMQIKKTSENPLLDTLYATLLKGREHELLHRNMTGE